MNSTAKTVIPKIAPHIILQCNGFLTAVAHSIAFIIFLLFTHKPLCYRMETEMLLTSLWVNPPSLTVGSSVTQSLIAIKSFLKRKRSAVGKVTWNVFVSVWKSVSRVKKRPIFGHTLQYLANSKECELRGNI